jgi:hypothetical protein
VWEDYEYDVQVPYNYYICTVTLENFNLSHVPIYIMSQDQLSMYRDVYGKRSAPADLFRPPVISANISQANTRTMRFLRLRWRMRYSLPFMEEATKYLGFPYVWGGSSPSTSFDCSGFVSWVINHSGWDVGRLARRDYAISVRGYRRPTSNPATLCFLPGHTTHGVSHVGFMSVRTK